MTVLETILSTASTAVLAALIGAHIALRRYRSERLWDRKLQAYVDLLESLFYIRSFNARTIQRIEEGRPMDSAHVQTLGQKASAGYEAVRKAAAVGSVLLSAEAAKRLNKLEDDLDDPHYDMDIHEEASAVLSLAQRAITDLRAIAARDLRIPQA